MFENSQRENIGKIGKAKLVETLFAQFKVHYPTDRAAEQDAANFKNEAAQTLLATKLFIENIHFDLTYCPLKHLGYKMVTVSLSDILAENALPKFLSITLSVSNRFSLEAMQELISGMAAACARYHVDVLQLDVNSSYQGLIAAFSVIGEVADNQLVTRSGAKENDLICVSGDFGAAYTGLLLLEREKKIFEVNPNAQPDFDGYDYLLERQLKPEARRDIIEKLREKKIVPTSMILVSNGLAAAAMHLSKASNVGCFLYENKLPIDILTFQTLKELNIVATTIALNGGEDYELMFTVSQSDYEKVKEIENVSVIGYIKDAASGNQLITNDERQLSLSAQEFTPTEE